MQYVISETALAHIGHGCNVTYIIQSDNRQLLIFFEAFSITINSACLVTEFLLSFKLNDLAIIILKKFFNDIR